MNTNGLRHPTQPIGFDDHGTIRFKQNGIVRMLLDDGPYDLNQLSLMVARGQFRAEDYTQLMQLIGYSVSGFGELSSVPRSLVEEADAKAEALRESYGYYITDDGDEETK